MSACAATALPASAPAPAPRQACPGRSSRLAAPAAAQRHAQRRPSAVRASAAADLEAAAAGGATAPPLLALKEWAPTCAALAAGEQTVLLRKGGIKEPTFTPAAREFLLFPTSFHTDAQLLKPAAAAKYAAEVQYDPKAQRELSFGVHAVITGAWTTHDPEVLQALNALHVWAPGFLEQRLKWRGAQPITVLELRATRLAQPLVVPPQEAFFGCFSWVDLGASPEAAAAATAHHGAPALDDAAFGMAQGLCRQQLHRLADLRELVF